MHNCPICGNQLNGKEAFCPNCGISIDRNNAFSTENIDQVNHRNTAVPWIFVALVIQAILFVGSNSAGKIGGYMFLGGLYASALVLAASIVCIIKSKSCINHKGKSLAIVFTVLSSIVLVLALVLSMIAANSFKNEGYVYNNETNSNRYNSQKHDYVNDDYFSQLTFSNEQIKTGKINDTVSVEVTNHSNAVLRGSITAYIYNNGEIAQTAALRLPTSGLQPNETATISGICNTINGNYDRIDFQESYLYEN